jgi:hypothetical protein
MCPPTFTNSSPLTPVLEEPLTNSRNPKITDMEKILNRSKRTVYDFK